MLNGKYVVETVLGQGGFGVTYLAKHTLLEKQVAIKEFFPSEYCSRDSDTSHVTLGTQTNLEFVARLRKKFITEARNIAKLNHDNIVKISDVFEENDTAYYVMDYVEGSSLDSLVKKGGAMTEERAAKYVRGVAQALKSMHDSHIMHLDIKPANIMVRKSDDTPVVIDFGLSKEYNNTGDSPSVTINAVSHGYSPLEQYSSDGIKKFSPQTDIYALGGTLYKLVTGKSPIEASQRMEQGLEMPKTLSPKMVAIINQTMAMSRVDRPESAQKVIELLDDLTAAPAPAAPAPAAKPAQKKDTTRVITPEAKHQAGPKHQAAAKQQPAPQPSKSSKKKTTFVAIAIFVAAAAITVLLFGSKKNQENIDAEPEVKTTMTEEVVQEPAVEQEAATAEPAKPA